MRIVLLLCCLAMSAQAQNFRAQQQRYPRVRQAYAHQRLRVQQLLDKAGIGQGPFQLYIRAFKQERVVEVWARGSTQSKFVLLTSYAICSSSGGLGPKRRAGDDQVPEGLYHIDRYNPTSNFHLSLGINYPNVADKVLGEKGNLGGDIFIHGSCVTIGCIPLTDAIIEQLYVLATEARARSQQNVVVHIYPARLSDAQCNKLIAAQPAAAVVRLWQDLHVVYQFFEQHRCLPRYHVSAAGRYVLDEGCEQ